MQHHLKGSPMQMQMQMQGLPPQSSSLHRQQLHHGHLGLQQEMHMQQQIPQQSMYQQSNAQEEEGSLLYPSYYDTDA